MISNTPDSTFLRIADLPFAVRGLTILRGDEARPGWHPLAGPYLRREVNMLRAALAQLVGRSGVAIGEERDGITIYRSLATVRLGDEPAPTPRPRGLHSSRP